MKPNDVECGVERVVGVGVRVGVQVGVGVGVRVGVAVGNVHHKNIHQNHVHLELAY